MQAYLFVHFREKTTPDGEQVHFALSRDGFRWEMVNNGNPVLWAYHGDKGVRDFTVVRSRIDNRFYILATDLSLAYGLRNQYHGSWDEISRHGSKCLSVWESDDLVNWTEQRLAQVADEAFGCVWAPDAVYDEKRQEYVLHWSSAHEYNDFQEKGIYCCRTRDFHHFTKPEPLYRPEGEDVIDSAIYEEDGRYYLFVKFGGTVRRVALLSSDTITGKYIKMDAFDAEMEKLEAGVYEAPTAVRLADGRWCLFLDYYGAPGAAQGYVPFVADSLKSGVFVRADEEFSFPYGFKHGTILTITEEEYDRIRMHDWSDKGWV